MDFPNPQLTPRIESPGEHFERVASIIAEVAMFVGLHLTPKGREALAILIGETSSWWNHSDNAQQMRRLVSLIMSMARK